MSHRAAIYTRISKDRESSEVGVSNQEEACRELAKQHELDVVAVYSDNDRGASTRSRKDRPGFEALCAAVEAGEVDVVVGYSMSRLTRRPLEWERLIAMHERHGVEFVYKVSPRYDLSTADGRATARTVAAWDGAEAERTGERLKFANDAKTAKGMPQGRPRVFGYAKDGVTPYEPEAGPIREAYAHVLNGGTVRALTAAWNEAGLRTARGSAWNGTEVRRVLLRERNAGILVVRGLRQAESRITPLVDMDTWEAVGAILRDPRRSRRGPATGERWLTGVMECACGRPMMVGSSWSNGVGSPAYACQEIRRVQRNGGSREGRHAQIIASVVEEGVVESVIRALTLDAVDGETGSFPEAAEVVRLRAKLTKIEQERIVAQELAFVPGADRAHLTARITSLGLDHEAASAELDRALSHRSAADVVATLEAAVRDILNDTEADDVARGRAIRAQWDELPLETRRDVTRAKLRIVVAPGGKGSGHGMRRVSIEAAETRTRVLM